MSQLAREGVELAVTQAVDVSDFWTGTIDHRQTRPTTDFSFKIFEKGEILRPFSGNTPSKLNIFSKKI